jgi:GNAT superfamily N-acetyltransferase
MLELTPAQTSPALRALCPTNGPTYRRCHAVLAGTASGRILTDAADAPSWVAVQECSDDGTLFVGGAVDKELMAELVALLRRERSVVVGVLPDDPLLALLPPAPDYDGGAIDFEERAPEVDLGAMAQPPDGLRLARIDEQFLPRCAWGPWMVASMTAALDNGLGYCLLDDEQVVAEAFAGPRVAGVLEMGTITHEDYRGRGLGTVVCAQTILECERHGFRTWWNTATTNIASARLARKLGYRVERPYRVLAWFTSPAP